MKMKNQLPPLFGANIDPTAHKINLAFQLARTADTTGLDLIGVQDHAYNANFLETWTFITGLALATERVRVMTNVLTTPLRSPAMLAKMAATLDVMSNGRVELGLGAGGIEQGIRAFGGEFGTPGERYQAFEESMAVIRGLWNSAGKPFSFNGKFHQVDNVQFGPIPTQPIRIWTGSLGPRAVKLTGRTADGLIVSMSYIPPEQLPEINRLLDEGAAEAGRKSTDIRRAYNIAGAITDNGSRIIPRRQGLVIGSAKEWAEKITGFYQEHRQDTFLFWPVAGEEQKQIEIFANEVVPMVREAVTTSA